MVSNWIWYQNLPVHGFIESFALIDEKEKHLIKSKLKSEWIEDITVKIVSI